MYLRTENVFLCERERERERGKSQQRLCQYVYCNIVLHVCIELLKEETYKKVVVLVSLDMMCCFVAHSPLSLINVYTQTTKQNNWR